MIYGSIICKRRSAKHFWFSSGRGVVHVTLRSVFIRVFSPVLVVTGCWSQYKTGRVIIIIILIALSTTNSRTQKSFYCSQERERKQGLYNRKSDCKCEGRATSQNFCLSLARWLRVMKLLFLVHHKINKACLAGFALYHSALYFSFVIGQRQGFSGGTDSSADFISVQNKQTANKNQITQIMNKATWKAINRDVIKRHRNLLCVQVHLKSSNLEV